MHLSSHERSIHVAHEHAREAAAEGPQPDVTCTYCEVGLGEDTTHLLGGEAFCAGCALDEVSRLRVSATWSALSPGQQLEVWEVLGAVANERESQLRTQLRAVKAVR